MAVIETNVKANVNLLLDNGTTTSGAQKTASLSIGTVNVNAQDNSKYLAIKNALAPLIAKETIGLRKTVVTELDEE